jgi:N-methylhydantoinase A
VASIRAAFDEAYTRFYNRPVPGSDVEVLSFAVQVATETPEETVSPAPRPATAPAPARSQAVRETTTGAVSDYTAHDRASLGPGARVAGPAIIAEDETSTLVAPGWTARLDGFGYIVMARE